MTSLSAGDLKDAIEGAERELARRLKLRLCQYCGKLLDARAGFIETIHQPDGLRRDFCSAECLHWQLHEDEKAE